MQTFTIVDKNAQVVGYCQEVESGVYRVFSTFYVGGQKDFTDVSELLEETGGIGLQAQLFESSAPTQQLSLFTKGEKSDEGYTSVDKR